MVCGRLGFLVRLIDLMAVVQNGTGKSNLPHACALADGDVVVKWKKQDRKSTRLNSSHLARSRMPSSA